MESGGMGKLRGEIIGAAKPSVRAGVIAAAIVSIVTLLVATFELSMADWRPASCCWSSFPWWRWHSSAAGCGH
jgi:hypothetical protein